MSQTVAGARCCVVQSEASLERIGQSTMVQQHAGLADSKGLSISAQAGELVDIAIRRTRKLEREVGANAVHFCWIRLSWLGSLKWTHSPEILYVRRAFLASSELMVTHTAKSNLGSASWSKSASTLEVGVIKCHVLFLFRIPGLFQETRFFKPSSPAHQQLLLLQLRTFG